MNGGSMKNNEPWMQHAVCVSIGVEMFYPDNGEDWKETVALCLTRCPVRNLCLDYAMRTEDGFSPDRRHGIYGGMTPKARAKYQPVWLLEREVAA